MYAPISPVGCDHTGWRGRLLRRLGRTRDRFPTAGRKKRMKENAAEPSNRDELRVVSHLTVKERRQRESSTEKMPSVGPCAMEPADDRPDPITLLEAQAVGRIPELLPVRYGRMLVSPFAFYRGARRSWHLTCQRCPIRSCMYSFVATRTSRILGVLPRRNGN